MQLRSLHFDAAIHIVGRFYMVPTSTRVEYLTQGVNVQV